MGYLMRGGLGDLVASCPAGTTAETSITLGDASQVPLHSLSSGGWCVGPAPTCPPCQAAQFGPPASDATVPFNGCVPMVTAADLQAFSQLAAEPGQSDAFVYASLVGQNPAIANCITPQLTLNPNPSDTPATSNPLATVESNLGIPSSLQVPLLIGAGVLLIWAVIR